MATAKEKKDATKAVISIKPPNIKTLEFRIIGTAPYVQHCFGEKAIKQIKAKHEAGSTSRSKTKKEKRNFDEDYRNATHFSTEGWKGIPAAAFRNACISACRTVGFKMTVAKLSIWFESDGLDAVDKSPLIKFVKGTPKKHLCYARNETGVVDLRCRPMWDPGWVVDLRVSFDADQFTGDDVANLLARVGLQVGIGEGRPDSKKSCGMGWGLFRIQTAKA